MPKQGIKKNARVFTHVAWVLCAFLAAGGLFLFLNPSGQNGAYPTSSVPLTVHSDVPGARGFSALPRSASPNFASVGGNAPIAYINFTLTNTHSSLSTPVNFQQKITTNPSGSALYFAADLRNVNWQTASGSILGSWLESGASNLSSSTIYWVNLGVTQIGPLSSLTIYEVIYAPTVNVMDGITTGAYPTYTGTYGQYDNGKGVFQTLYDDFPGPAINGTLWTQTGAAAQSVSQGLSIIHSGTDSYLTSVSATYAPTNIFEVNWTGTYPLNSGANQQLDFGYRSLNTPATTALYWRADFANKQQAVTAAASGPTTIGTAIGLSQTGWTIFGVWANATTASCSYGGTVSTITTNVDATAVNVYLENNRGGNTGVDVNVQWVHPFDPARECYAVCCERFSDSH